MSNNDCPQQSELVALIHGGSIGDDIQAHLAGCEECREVERVVRELAPLASHPRDIPPIAGVYWRAHAQDILGESSRRTWSVVSPLRYLHLGAGIVLIAAALVVTAGPLFGLAKLGEFGIAGPLIALVTAAAGLHLSFGDPPVDLHSR